MSCGTVDERAVYLCTGNPDPQDVRAMLGAMLEKEFSEAYEAVRQVKTIKGLATADILRELHTLVQFMPFPTQTKILLLDKMSELEYRISQGASENVQLGALVGIFTIVREQTAGTD